MRILFLTNKDADNKEELLDFIAMYGDSVFVCYDVVDVGRLAEDKIDFLVSDRYPYIISGDVLDYVGGRAINTHPSLLPFNRGYQPHFFSIYYDTPKGVSIHLVDKGVDTGKVLFQKELSFCEDDTLRTSYYIARKAIVDIFCENWRDILNGYIDPSVQYGVGGVNYKRDFDNIFCKYEKGWDTKIKDVYEA